MRKLLWIDEDAPARERVEAVFSKWDFEIHFAEPSSLRLETLYDYHALVWDFTFAGKREREFLQRLRCDTVMGGFPVLLRYSREIPLEERMFLAEHRFPHLSKWTNIWTTLQKVQQFVD